MEVVHGKLEGKWMEKIERFCWLLRVFVEESTELGSIVDKISRALN